MLDPSFTPEGVMATVWANKRLEDQKAAGATFCNSWISDPGCTGTIEKVHEGGGKTTLWLRYPASIIRGGSFLIAVSLKVNDRHSVVSNLITFSGRIDELRVLAGQVPEYQIIVRDARVLTVNGK